MNQLCGVAARAISIFPRYTSHNGGSKRCGSFLWNSQYLHHLRYYPINVIPEKLILKKRLISTWFCSTFLWFWLHSIFESTTTFSLSINFPEYSTLFWLDPCSARNEMGNFTFSHKILINRFGRWVSLLPKLLHCPFIGSRNHFLNSRWKIVIRDEYVSFFFLGARAATCFACISKFVSRSNEMKIGANCIIYIAIPSTTARLYVPNEMKCLNLHTVMLVAVFVERVSEWASGVSMPPPALQRPFERCENLDFSILISWLCASMHFGSTVLRTVSRLAGYTYYGMQVDRGFEHIFTEFSMQSTAIHSYLSILSAKRAKHFSHRRNSAK